MSLNSEIETYRQKLCIAGGCRVAKQNAMTALANAKMLAPLNEQGAERHLVVVREFFAAQEKIPA